MNFMLVTGIGHCATKWLATAMDSDEDVTAFHELKMQVSKKSWVVAAKYERRNGAKSALYRPYFKKLQKVETFGVMEANSWVPWLVPQVHEIMPIYLVKYVVRHGVSQLHSLWNHSSAWRDASESDYIYQEYIVKNMPRALHKTFYEYSKWERLCLLWASSKEMVKTLNAMGINAEVVTFEELTQQDVLEGYMPNSTLQDRQDWRGLDINRKLPPGPRRPVDLWQTWNDRQKETFINICGPTMDHYGYKIPE